MNNFVFEFRIQR